MRYHRWREVTERNEWSRHAFNCHKCPEKGCPAWTTMDVIDPDTGSLNPVSGCLFRFVPQLFSESLGITHQVGKQQAVQTQTIKQSTVVLGRLMQGVQQAQAALPGAPEDAEVIDAEPAS